MTLSRSLPGWWVLTGTSGEVRVWGLRFSVWSRHAPGVRYVIPNRVSSLHLETLAAAAGVTDRFVIRLLRECPEAAEVLR
jgi:hypothetical protein